MIEVFAKVMDIVNELYNLESPFFGLKYIEIVAGFVILRVSVALFRSLFVVSDSPKTWGDKEYKSND